MLRGHSPTYMWDEIENLQEATGIELEMLASHWTILNNRLDEAEAELEGVVQRTDAEIGQLEAELTNLRERLWRHCDKCVAECSTACNAMHTYEPGCWFAPTGKGVCIGSERTAAWQVGEAIATMREHIQVANETTIDDPRADAGANAIVGCTLPGVSFRMEFHDRLARKVLVAADDVDPMRQSNDLSHLYVSRYAFEDAMVECERLRNAVVLAVQQYAYDVPAEVDRIMAEADEVENEN